MIISVSLLNIALLAPLARPDGQTSSQQHHKYNWHGNGCNVPWREAVDLNVVVQGCILLYCCLDVYQPGSGGRDLIAVAHALGGRQVVAVAV